MTNGPPADLDWGPEEEGPQADHVAHDGPHLEADGPHLEASSHTEKVHLIME